jgi:hypothetical protein
VTISVLSNDSDPDGDAIQITRIVTPPLHGVASIQAGRVVYTPDFNFTGTDTFVYEICDNGDPVLCDTATVTVTISPPGPGGVIPNIISDNLRHGILIEGNRNVFGVEITSNAIENNGVAGALGQGVRIHALNAAVRGARIESNTINGNGEGGIEIQANNEISATQILSNEIKDNPRHGVRLLVSTPAPLIGPAVLISGNTIIGSTRCGDLDAGGTFVLSDITLAEGMGLLIDAKNVEVRKNGIKCNEIGVKVAKHEGVSIRQNNILSNELFGVDATLVLPETVDATQNWWGAAAGPAVSPPSALPNAVTVNVDASNPLSGTVTDAPDPFVVIEDLQLAPEGRGKLLISLLAVPQPGVAGFQVGPTGALTFDPRVIQVERVDALVPYQVLSSEIDNTNGRVTFAVSNPTGGSYLVDGGALVVLTVTAAPGAKAGDETEVTITQVDLLEAPTPDGGLPLVTTIFSGKVEIVPQGQQTTGGALGDLNGDGALDVTDARIVAEAAIGVRTLTDEERALADVAPPFGIIDVTDARFLAEAALGLRAVSVTAVPQAELSVWEWLLRLLGLARPASEVRLAATTEGLRVELPGAAVDAQGAVRYDPRAGEALELVGEGGWLVLAQAVDPERGRVRFAAVRLSLSEEPGALVLRMAQGRAVGVQVELAVLRDAQGRDLSYRVRSASAASVAVVQVVPQGNALNFRAQGQDVTALAVEVYDLGGRAVYRSGFTAGSTLRWNLLDAQGRLVANGVYLYIVQIRDATGQITRTEVRKLLVLH